MSELRAHRRSRDQPCRGSRVSGGRRHRGAGLMVASAVAPKRVLVVEDEDAIRQTLRYNLSREGYAVSEANTGPTALSAARRERPDLILLDLMLPELNGLEVCRVLRQEMSTPILILTAKGSELDKVVGLQVGADDYITKPFSLRELFARMTAVLRRSEQRDVRPEV